jgi:hypothetical protein
MLGQQEPHLGQDLQVRGHGGLDHVDGGDDLAHVHRRAPAGEQGHDLDPGRVGERLEPGGVFGRGGPVKRLGGFIHRPSTISDEAREGKSG